MAAINGVHILVDQDVVGVHCPDKHCVTGYANGHYYMIRYRPGDMVKVSRAILNMGTVAGGAIPPKTAIMMAKMCDTLRRTFCTSDSSKLTITKPK